MARLAACCMVTLSVVYTRRPRWCTISVPYVLSRYLRISSTKYGASVFRGACRCSPSGCAMACLRLGFRDFARARHELQHQIAPRERALRMQDRRITRTADQSRQQCRFLHVQLAHGLAEIIFRSRFKSVIAVGKINLIAVHRENLLLRVVPLDLQGQQRFLNFSAHPAIGAVQKKRPGKLHRDGAGAFHDAMRQQDPSRPRRPRA